MAKRIWEENDLEDIFKPTEKKKTQDTASKTTEKKKTQDSNTTDHKYYEYAESDDDAYSLARPKTDNSESVEESEEQENFQSKENGSSSTVSASPELSETLKQLLSEYNNNKYTPKTQDEIQRQAENEYASLYDQYRISARQQQERSDLALQRELENTIQTLRERGDTNDQALLRELENNLLALQQQGETNDLALQRELARNIQTLKQRGDTNDQALIRELENNLLALQQQGETNDLALQRELERSIQALKQQGETSDLALQQQREGLQDIYDRQREDSAKQYRQAYSAADRQMLGRGMQRSSYAAQTLANINQEGTEAQQKLWDKQGQEESNIDAQRQLLARQIAEQQSGLTQQTEAQRAQIAQQIANQASNLTRQTESQRAQIAQQIADQISSLSQQTEDQRSLLSRQISDQTSNLTRQTEAQRTQLAQQIADQISSSTRQTEAQRTQLAQQLSDLLGQYDISQANDILKRTQDLQDQEYNRALQNQQIQNQLGMNLYNLLYTAERDKVKDSQLEKELALKYGISSYGYTSGRSSVSSSGSKSSSSSSGSYSDTGTSYGNYNRSGSSGYNQVGNSGFNYSDYAVSKAAIQAGILRSDESPITTFGSTDLASKFYKEILNNSTKTNTTVDTTQEKKKARNSVTSLIDSVSGY